MGHFARGAVSLARVVEYLGLPGVGKTWQLGADGYCGLVGGYPSPVPLGLSIEKIVNVIYGLLLKRRLLPFLARPVRAKTESFTSVFRSVAVLFERIGRSARLRREPSKRSMHIDEGPFQALWSFFCEKELNEASLLSFERCVEILIEDQNLVCYVSCPRAQHVARVLKRGKRGYFDSKLAAGDFSAYRRARKWMAALLCISRRLKVDLVYIRAID